MKYRIFTALSLCLALVSCNKWLDVTSDSTTTAQKQFSSESGFRDALIGVYLKLGSSSMYGQTLSWRTLEEMSQNYTYIASHTDKDAWSLNQQSATLESAGSGAWSGLYNAIANLNNLLRYEEKNRDCMPAVQDSIIRGEALALRAYCHLDLLRMFGKGNLASRNLLNEKTIPYSTSFSKQLPAQITYREYLDKLYADLDEAIALLKADPQYAQYDRPDDYYDGIAHEGFVSIYESERRIRMNYFAAHGLYARALMWEGTASARKKAADHARIAVGEVIDNSNEQYWWSTTSSSTLSSASFVDRSGLLYPNECLWLLYFDFLSIQKTGYQSQWFSGLNNQSNVVNVPTTYADEMFEVTSKGYLTDYRYTYGLDIIEGTGMSLLKFRQTDPNGKERSVASGNRMPMLRVSEMFYILAECENESGNAGKAVEYLNSVREGRNLPELTADGLSKDDIDNEIFKEYRKEMLGEGQLFFYFKRKGATSITGANGTVSDLGDANYVFPIPTTDIENGLIQY